MRPIKVKWKNVSLEIPVELLLYILTSGYVLMQLLIKAPLTTTLTR